MSSNFSKENVLQAAPGHFHYMFVSVNVLVDVQKITYGFDLIQDMISKNVSKQITKLLKLCLVQDKKTNITKGHFYRPRY